MMRICFVLLLLAGTAAPPPAKSPDFVRFEAVNVYVDSGSQPLACYQFEVKAGSGEVLLAGLEGGDHPAYNAAPYYDPAALLRDRVIVAAFSTASDLPRGRTRVARLMVQVVGPVEPTWDCKLMVAGSPDGKPISATIQVRTERLDASARGDLP